MDLQLTKWTETLPQSAEDLEFGGKLFKSTRWAMFQFQELKGRRASELERERDLLYSPEWVWCCSNCRGGNLTSFTVSFYGSGFQRLSYWHQKNKIVEEWGDMAGLQASGMLVVVGGLEKQSVGKRMVVFCLYWRVWHNNEARLFLVTCSRGCYWMWWIDQRQQKKRKKEKEVRSKTCQEWRQVTYVAHWPKSKLPSPRCH